VSLLHNVTIRRFPLCPTAILSRQKAGIRGQSLIINLPGKSSVIDDCLNAVFPAVLYCIDFIEESFLVINESECKIFRPKHDKRVIF